MILLVWMMLVLEHYQKPQVLQLQGLQGLGSGALHHIQEREYAIFASRSALNSLLFVFTIVHCRHDFCRILFLRRTRRRMGTVLKSHTCTQTHKHSHNHVILRYIWYCPASCYDYEIRSFVYITHIVNPIRLLHDNTSHSMKLYRHWPSHVTCLKIW